MLRCPQPGLHLIRGRNEPFQQWSQAGKALGSVQSLVVVSEGQLSTHQRGFGFQNCNTRRALRENGFRLGWEKQLGRERMGQVTDRTWPPPEPGKKTRGSFLCSAPASLECPQHQGGDKNPCAESEIRDDSGAASTGGFLSCISRGCVSVLSVTAVSSHPAALALLSLCHLCGHPATLCVPACRQGSRDSAAPPARG